MFSTTTQFETFIRKGINTSYGQKLLAEIVGDTGASTTKQTVEITTSTATNTTPKSTQSAHPNDTALSAKADGGATVEG